MTGGDPRNPADGDPFFRGDFAAGPGPAEGGDAGSASGGPIGETVAWPNDAAVPPGTGVAAQCDACGLAWRIHTSLAGYRLRCRCGEWVRVAATATARGLPGGAALAAAETAGDLAWPAEPTEAVPVPPRELREVRAWDGAPLRPDKGGGWSLRQASVEDRQRWTTRTVLELAAVMACFWVPALVLQLALPAHRWTFWIAVAQVVSCLLLLLVMTTWSAKAFAGLRRASLLHFGEAVGGALVAAVLAILWVGAIQKWIPEADTGLGALRRDLGLPVLLFVISFCPGFFEELAFRGLLQARLAVLMGPWQGAFASGVVFALAHGVTAGLPFHAALGVWLAWLRLRSGSLVPGMVAHALYNGVIVVALS